MAVDVLVQLLLRYDPATVPKQVGDERYSSAESAIGAPRTLTFICRSSSLMSPAVMTDDACPAERRAIERSRASNSSI